MSNIFEERYQNYVMNGMNVNRGRGYGGYGGYGMAPQGPMNGMSFNRGYGMGPYNYR
jgi:hypothetical protein